MDCPEVEEYSTVPEMIWYKIIFASEVFHAQAPFSRHFMKFDLFLLVVFLFISNHLALSALYSIEIAYSKNDPLCQISVLNESCGDSEPKTAGTAPYSYIMEIEKFEHCVIG